MTKADRGHRREQERSDDRSASSRHRTILRREPTGRGLCDGFCGILRPELASPHRRQSNPPIRFSKGMSGHLGQKRRFRQGATHASRQRRRSVRLRCRTLRAGCQETRLRDWALESHPRTALMPRFVCRIASLDSRGRQTSEGVPRTWVLCRRRADRN